MKLVRVHLRGFRRFTKADVYLDEPVIALVGPNEAGKTSLLKALAYLGNDSPINESDFTRGVGRSSGWVVQARFVLDEEERKAVSRHHCDGTPKWFLVNKMPDGSRDYETEPPIRRTRRYRTELIKRLRSLPQYTILRWVLDERLQYTRNEQMAEMSVRAVAQSILGLFESDDEELDDDVLTLGTALLRKLRASGESATGSKKRALASFLASLEAAIKYESTEHPYDTVLEELGQRVPEFLPFDEEHRSLPGEYPIGNVAAAPASLKNLLSLGGVELAELSRAVQVKDHGRRSMIDEQANANLSRLFGAAWSQSGVHAHVRLDEAVVRVQVKAPGTYAPIAERSDGLRAFVALLAYVSSRERAVAPILLVDEAETHLHYDAQADLVRVFEGQTQAAQIIYSTHSAACLPSDLGTGIRVVKPIVRSDGEDTGQSSLSGAFWEAGPGFSPLMLAMGASVLALVPARRAIVAEGASELLLLPRILREATGCRNLEFQVAPGLASVAPAEVKDLELEAPMVAYITDGDSGGLRHAKKLRRAGVPQERVVSLDAGTVLEDYLDLKVYLSAVNEDLRLSYGDHLKILAENLENDNRPLSLARWCKAQSIAEPSKIRVASRIATMAMSGRRIYNSDRKRQLEALNVKIRHAVGLPS